MKRISNYPKAYATFFLVLQILQLLLPQTSFALTSGPAQPESKAFTPAGTTDMVDLFSGDFNYNLPLLDVDGYPVNLGYQSGSGIDDEASWVGLGWNINVGSINRQLRGIPDDAKADVVITESYLKPRITVGGRLNAKVEVFGGAKVKAQGTLSLGIFSDNYNGIGAELGANIGLKSSLTESGSLTGRMGVGLTSSTASGVDVVPSLSLHRETSDKKSMRSGISANLGYNTRAGLKDLTLNLSHAPSNWYGNSTIVGAKISYNTEPVYPQPQLTFLSNYGTFSFDGGFSGAGIFAGAGAQGYRSIRQLASRLKTSPSYGFLYADFGKDNRDALMDFIREKDNPVIPELPNLAIPVTTADIFSFTNQAGSGQFRLQRGGGGVLFDNQSEDQSVMGSVGLDAGAGGYAHGGVSLFEQVATNATRKWAGNNGFLARGDFQNSTNANPAHEPVYFKKVGEKTVNIMQRQTTNRAPNEYLNDNPVAVEISGRTAHPSLRSGGQPVAANNLSQTLKQPRTTSITYLTAKEADGIPEKKHFRTYPFMNSDFNPNSCHRLPVATTHLRSGNTPSANRREHHISEMTVTDEGGSRSVYGIPVYNTKQEEYTIALGEAYDKTEVSTKNQVPVIFQPNGKINHYKGIDHYYSRQQQPGYASSFLLTEILSPDYVDVTGNGISDDDLGTAMKFNYSKGTNFRWRSPVERDKATLNKGLLADPDDDKASFIYGEKETFYLHSIESKNKIAYFILADRADGLGVVDERGGINTSAKLKLLKEIRLYSKADISKPIKTVIFDYGYDLCQQLPNFDPSAASNYPNKGKLTLKKVSFKYGDSPKGLLHPYEFEYHGQESNSAFTYGYLKTDRWGVYKLPSSNKGLNLRNDEFPYANQDKTTADQWAGIWNLRTIKLPTGGEINVTYESDDYAYVQNKRASEMIPIASMLNANNQPTTNLKDARALVLDLDIPCQNLTSAQQFRWFRDYYLSGSDYLYTKLFVNLSDVPNSTSDEHYDFVPCYAKVTGAIRTGNTMRVTMENITVSGNRVTNPIALAAWQRMRLEYPRYAYPGFKNRVKDNNFSQALKAAVGAVVNAAKNLDELRRNFNERAFDKNFATRIKSDKSFVRVATKQYGVKLGGGSRVKKIQITDNWSAMSLNQNTNTATYGQEYDYTTKERDVCGNERTISSGVAANEPNIGSDENTLRQPIPYVQNIRGAINNFYNLEEPLGESFFPSPSVGYSKVTVRNLGENGLPDTDNKTGSTVQEFYTAKDYPVLVKALANKRLSKGPSGWYHLYGSNSFHELTYSQGYTIELNDMHGKARATRIINQSGSEISSTVYDYHSANLNSGEKKLDNSVSTISSEGLIYRNQTIGRDLEVFTDMREQETRSLGKSINLGFDVVPIGFFLPVPIPHLPINANTEYKLFRSAVTVKVVQYYGLIAKVTKTENGSSIASENLVYDELTGEAVISQTNNEFDRPVYSVNIPAYWINDYRGMGGAYQNEGTVISALTAPQGIVPGAFVNFLQEGDELIDLKQPGRRYWVIRSAIAQGPMMKRIVDRIGSVQNLSNADVKIVRSGFRNLTHAPAGAIVCLENPVVFDATLNRERLEAGRQANLASLKVLSASATTYRQEWGMKQCLDCPPGYQLTADSLRCDIIRTVDASRCFGFCRGSLHTAYGADGAYISSTPTGNPVNFKSNFWGGACVPCSGGSAKSGTPLVYPVFDSSEVEQPKTGFGTMALPTCNRYEKTHPCTGSFCGRLNNAGIWLCEGNFSTSRLEPVAEWIGFEKCFTVPETKDYFIGYGADNFLRLYIDGVLLENITEIEEPIFRRWRIKPRNLTAGQHIIRVETNNPLAGPASVGVEIYNNTYQQLASTSANISLSSMIFSTARDIIDNHDVQVMRNIGTSTIYKYTTTTGAPISACELVNSKDKILNPYVTGFEGNWRPHTAEVYQVNRSYNDIFNDQQKGVDIKNAGYFNTFDPFWQTNGTAPYNWSKSPSASANWVTANQITLYNQSGEELENRDALGRFSGATFSFREKLPAAVASNARHREIFYESFEDMLFRSNCDVPELCSTAKIETLGTEQGGINGGLVNTVAHSGNYSLNLRSGIKLVAKVHNKEAASESYLGTNQLGERTIKSDPNIYPLGFQPYPAGKYLLSFWANKRTGLNVRVNNVPINAQPTSVLADGWARHEYVVDFTTIYGTHAKVDIHITGSGGTYIDDLRIHPVDGHMKSYAYDLNSLRLMAEMDENNFATFYEYDDEGSLIRVKKESERGIITIKENRSSLRKTN